MIFKKIVNYYKRAWQQLKIDFKKIDKDYEKKKEKTNEEMLVYEKRYNRFLEKDITLNLTPTEIFLWKVCPIFFKSLVILICIIAALLGGIYYLFTTIIISCIIGYLFIKIF